MTTSPDVPQFLFQTNPSRENERRAILAGSAKDLQRLALLLAQQNSEVLYDVVTEDALRRSGGTQALDDAQAQCSAVAASGEVASLITGLESLDPVLPVQNAWRHLRQAERQLARLLWQASEAGLSLRDLARVAPGFSHEKIRQVIREEANRQGEGLNFGWEGQGLQAGTVSILASRPGAGKLQILRTRAGNRQTTFFELPAEMPPIEMVSGDVIAIEWHSQMTLEQIQNACERLAGYREAGRWVVHLMDDTMVDRLRRGFSDYTELIVIMGQGLPKVVKDRYGVTAKAAA